MTEANSINETYKHLTKTFEMFLDLQSQESKWILENLENEND